MCAKAVDQVSQTWEALIDNADLENVAQVLRNVDKKETQLNNQMNKLPLVQKMAKAT